MKKRHISLLKDRIERDAIGAVNFAEQEGWSENDSEMLPEVFRDLMGCRIIARNCQTVLLSSDQAVALLDSNIGDEKIRSPFPSLIVQFDPPIVERDFFPDDSLRTAKAIENSLSNYLSPVGDIPDPLLRRRISMVADQKDEILGLCIADIQEMTGNGPLDMSAAMYMKSGAISRSAWILGGETLVSESIKFDDDVVNSKRRIREWTESILAFLNAANVELVRREPSAKVNRKRKKRNKKPLSPFYVTRFNDLKPGESESQGGNRAGPSFRFDVRGHFRRLQSGKIIWVRPHQRGLANEIYRPRDYYDATRKKA